MDRVIDTRPDVYCTHGYANMMNELYAKSNTLSFSEQRGLHTKLQSIEKMLENANVYLDINLQELGLKYPFILTFFKSKGNVNLQHSSQLDKSRYNTIGVSLLDSDKAYKNSIPIQYTINTPNEKIDFLLKEESIKVHPDVEINKFHSWGFLQNVKLPVESVVFIDRYGFQSEDQIKENFCKIFRSLLICCKSDEFYLTIISDESSISVDKLQDLIEDVFYEVDSDKNLHFSVYYLPAIKMTHDRKILTNYFIVTSGNSFNYFKRKKINVDTRVTLTPVFYRNDLLEDLKAVKSELKKYRPAINGKNPLLEF